jgi:hypothetical protein
MEAARTSEVMADFYQSTWRYNPEDSHLYAHCHENLKSYKGIRFFFLTSKEYPYPSHPSWFDHVIIFGESTNYKPLIL